MLLVKATYVQCMFENITSNLHLQGLISNAHTSLYSDILLYPPHPKQQSTVSTVKRLYIPRATLAHSPTHTLLPPSPSNVVVIEVGTRGCTNRWAHMLRGRFIRLSHQLSGQTFLDALCVCVSLSVCLLTLSIEQVSSRSASSHS